MQRLNVCTLFLATTLCCGSLSLSSEYEDELRPSFISRRAIDGTRGRKYFNPQEDGFFDDYGYERGQYYGAKEKSGIAGLRSNVPGEPGVDYPAYEKIPRTSFSCFNRERGYYADEEAGCQVFHVCDEGLVSSFLCPIGSLFSQRLLTCDWWLKVPCLRSHEFYDHQFHADDISLVDDDVLRKATTRYEEDQERESDKNVPVVLVQKQSINQLEQGGGFKKRTGGRNRVRQRVEEQEFVRLRTIEEEKVERRSKVKGESSFRSSNTADSQGQHRRLSQDSYLKFPSPSTESTTVTTPTTPTTTTKTVAPTVTEESRTYETTPEVSRTTAAPIYETTSTQTFYQDTTSANGLTDVPTKRGLEEVEIETVRPMVGSHNSAYEYDDMEGKESIGLGNSHAERNLERNEDKVRTTEQNGDATTTLEFLENVTPAVTEKVEVTKVKLDENIQARESIGLVQSKVQERFQLFNDNQKVVAYENLSNDTEEKTEKTVIPVEGDATITTHQDLPETSTLYNNTEYSTEVTTSYTDIESGNTQSVQTTRTQEVRKMSGFLINVTEKRTTEPTTLSTDEIDSTDYQESLNSSDTSYTSTIPAVTVPNVEEQATTISSSVKRVSDTIEESNAPFEVTLMLNSSSSNFNSGQSSIGPELLSQLITEHVNEPINLNDVQIVKSDQVSQDNSAAQNQQQASNPVPGVRTYQNFRNYQNQHSRTQNYNNHRSQPMIATTFRNYQNHQVETQKPVSTTTQTPANYLNYQHQQISNIELPYQAKQVAEFHTTISQQFVPRTTQVPQQNYKNYQNYKDESTAFNNYQTYQEELKNFKNAKIQNVVSTTARNYLANEEAPLNTKNHQSSQKESTSFKEFQNYPNEQRINKNHHISHEELEDYRKYHVNYQTHHYPENFADYQKNEQQDYQNYNTKNYVSNESNNNFDNYQNHRYVDNSQNYENKENNNYSDYSNYDSTEDLIESPHFGEFGVRLTAKNHFVNTVKMTNKKTKITEDADAHTINSGLQGKDANFLWAMSQLAKNDRLPRPFTQTGKKFDENFSSQNNAHNANNFVNVNSKARNDGDDFNKFKQPSIYNNNYNMHDDYKVNKTEATDNYNVNYNANYNTNIQPNYNEDEYVVNVDEFAAPRLEPIPKNIYNLNSNVNLNQKDDSLDTVPSTYTSNNQQNINRPRQERILNYKQVPLTTENPAHFVKNSQLNHNAYNIPSTPDVNTVPFNNNQQFVQIPQPDYNEYNIENTQVPNKNAQVLSTPQSQPIDYSIQHSTQPSTESSSIQNENYQIFKSHRPQIIDFNFQHNAKPAVEPTQIPNKDVQIVNSPQPDRFSYNTHSTVESSHQLSGNSQVQENLQQEPVDYNFHHSIESSLKNGQIKAQSSHEDSHVPNENFQNMNSQPQLIDYNFQHSIESTVENTQVPKENYQNVKTTQPQPVDFTFQHTRPAVGNSHVSNQNYQNLKNTQSQPIDYGLQHSIQPAIENTPSPYKTIQILTNLQRQPVDYNFQQSTPSSIEDTQVTNKNLQIQPNSQPLPINYQFQKSTSSYVGSTPVPDKNIQPPISVQPQPADYSFEHNTPSSAENSYVSKESYHSVENTQSQPVEYHFEQSSELSHEDNQRPSENVRFPDNSESQPIDYNYHQSTPSSVENSQISHENYQTITSSHSPSINYKYQSSVENSQPPRQNHQPLETTQPKPINYSFRPTIQPPSKPNKNEESPSHDLRYQNYNVTKTLTKTTVETEFIPSLSFDFGSDQGRKEYLEALEKGLVPNDSAARANEDATASASVETEETKVGESDRKSRSRKSEESDSNMDNFKDTSEPMSGEE